MMPFPSYIQESMRLQRQQHEHELGLKQMQIDCEKERGHSRKKVLPTQSKPPLTVEEVRSMSDQELDYALNYDEGKPLRINSLGMLTDERIRRRKLVEGQNRDSFLTPITILLSMASILMAAAMWVKVFIPWLKNIF